MTGTFLPQVRLPDMNLWEPGRQVVEEEARCYLLHEDLRAVEGEEDKRPPGGSQPLGHQRFPQTLRAPRSWRTQWLLLYPVNPRSRSRPAWVLITNIEAAAQRPLDPLWAVATSNITLCMLRFSGHWTTCSYSCLLCPTQTLTITDIRVPATVLVASIANASNMPVDEL